MEDVRKMVQGTQGAQAAPMHASPFQGGGAPAELTGYPVFQKFSLPRDGPTMGVPPPAAATMDPMGAFAPLDVNMQEVFPTHQTPPPAGSRPATPAPRAPEANVSTSKAITGGGESTGDGESPGGFLSSRFGRYALLAALVAALVFTMRTVSTLLARRRPGRDPMQDFAAQGGNDDDGQRSEAGSETTVADTVDIEDPPSPPRKVQRKRRGKKSGSGARAKAALFAVPDEDDDQAAADDASAAPEEAEREPAPPDPMFLPLKKPDGP